MRSGIDRRNFLQGAGRLAVSGLAAGAAFDLLGGVSAQTPGPAPVRRPGIEKLKENLYVIGGADAEVKGAFTGGSILVFVTEKNGVLLVDAKNPGMGQVIIELVRSVTDKPITTVINTHTHIDHVGSNPELGGQIEFVAHANCLATLSEEKCIRVTGCQIFQGANAKFLPKKTFKDRMTLFSGNDRVELYYLGHCHTNGDAIVVIPSMRVMHPGDIYPGKYQPFIDVDNGGSGVGYANTLSKMVKELKNIDIIVPGHRDHGETWQDLVEYSDYHQHMVAMVREGLKAGKTPEQIANHYIAPTKYSSYGLNTSGAPTRFRTNIGITYSELRG